MYSFKKKLSGFTLVELIVVITILVILGTIAFIQLGGFAGSARDSARVSDMGSIMQGLELVLVKNGVVIPPDASDKGVITITASGTPIGYQGYAGANVLSSIKMSDAKDPLDKKYYTYVTNANYSKYQILGLMEDSSTLALNDTFGINQVYAGYETRIPATKGSSLGVLLGNTGVTLNMPVQELYESSSFTGVDLFTQVFTGSSNFSIAGEALNSVSSSPESCDTWIKNYPSLLGKDGTYRIKPSKTSSTLSVYCDMTTDGGGWTVFQKRFNGSIDFYRNWADYKTGFGITNGEYWLGNDKLNALANTNKELYVALTANDGVRVFAKYTTFQIDNEMNKYKLTIGNYSGTAGDSFSHQNSQNFSTFDQDNDKGASNCAQLYHGAWWYNACHYSNLNGGYLPGYHASSADGTDWYHFRGYQEGMKETKMMLR